MSKKNKPEKTGKWRVVLVLTHDQGDRQTFEETSNAPTQLGAISDAARHADVELAEDAEVMIYVEPIPQDKDAEKPFIVANFGGERGALFSDGSHRKLTLEEDQRGWDRQRQDLLDRGCITPEKVEAAIGPRPTETDPDPQPKPEDKPGEGHK